MKTAETLRREQGDKVAARLETFKKQGDLLAHVTELQNLAQILQDGLLIQKLAKRTKRKLPVGFGQPLKENVISVKDLWSEGNPPDYSHFSKLTKLQTMLMLGSSIRRKKANSKDAIDPGEIAIGRRIKPDDILGIVVSRENWESYGKPLSEFTQALDDNQKESISSINLSSLGNIQDWLIALCQSNQIPLYKAVETTHSVYDGQKGIDFEELWPEKETN